MRVQRSLRAWGAVLAIAVAAAWSPPSVGASELNWWDVYGPSRSHSQVFGSYTRGCLAGAVALPTDGDGYQVMRLSRERNFGHPNLIRFIEGLAASMRRQGWPGLLVGDLAQPRGGPMRSGHASHQVGLDADIWFLPSPGRRLTEREREEMSAISMVRSDGDGLDPARWTDGHVALLRTAASDPDVTRIFVHPAIKRRLCESVDGDRGWLGKVRPWWGHDSHFHVRLRCPPSSAACVDQAPPPAGDSCDASLAWWFSEEIRRELADFGKKPVKRRRITLAELPAQCRSVLTQQ